MISDLISFKTADFVLITIDNTGLRHSRDAPREIYHGKGGYTLLQLF